MLTFLKISVDKIIPICGVEGCTTCAEINYTRSGTHGMLFFMGMIVLTFVVLILFFPRFGKD